MDDGSVDTALIHQGNCLGRGKVRDLDMRQVAWQSGSPGMDLGVDDLHWIISPFVGAAQANAKTPGGTLPLGRAVGLPVWPFGSSLRPKPGRKSMELKGAVALVTGGNGGLGQRICHALGREGVNIAVMYAQSREQAEGVANELKSQYQINAAAFACDITDGP